MTDDLAGWGTRGTAGVSFAATMEFDDVAVDLGGRRVLSGFSLDMRPGEIICLLGESGSGKSTALRVAAGIQPVAAGNVRINGEIVSSPGHTVSPDRRGIGLMFQDFALFPHLTVLQNVLFGLRHLDRKSALGQARAALRRVGLSEREAEYPHVLSGGQQQRLALARSVAPRPGVLLLDEPFSSLDARLRETVRTETLAVLRETRVTSIVVTHDPEEAMVIGDRIALMRHGRIVQVGKAAEIYRRPADLSAARFFSPLTEIESTVVSGMAQTPLGPIVAENMPEGSAVTVAFRPAGGATLARQGAGVGGRIVAKREAIGIDILEVKVAGLDQPLAVRQAASDDMAVGRDVFVTLNQEHVLVFPRD
jgi:iron(III) transport system ATP-binding protein